uniref:Uncharacterized protein n=1 Tax=Compsopogon caeruleus TaxID=31354 RepID=A0A7S1T511_9RHOD|mmetsp:Transcript_10507/g.21156  ORF Transcript_10507/g.21156 Transcript_10507/m.21156 type:complete len:180 (+) Transcript_10507:57-596(+)
MENFFQEVNAKFRRAQTVAAPRLQEVSRTLTDSVREVKDGMNNLMMREAQGLYEEDEGLGQMIASVELMRQTLRALDLDVKQHRKDLIAASRSQHSFGEHSAMGGNRIQAIFEKYISEERIMAHLSFSASEISSSTVLDRFANEFGFPVEQLASAFEAKFSHEIAALRRRYTMEKKMNI